MHTPAIIQERYEHALRADVPLAKAGLNCFEGDDAIPLVDSIRFDHESIRDFLGEQGVEPKYFQQPFIHIFGAPHDREKRRHGQTVGSIGIKHVVYNDEAYFPYITMMIDPEKPDIDGANSTLRHELGHFKDGDYETPFYSKPGSSSLVRLMGMSAMMYNYLPSTAAAPSTTTEAVAAVALHSTLWLGGTFATVIPQNLSHILTPMEIKANRFARKHREFNPISLVDNPTS